MITLESLDGTYSIHQFDVKDVLPPEIFKSDFYSVTRTGDEISVVINDPVKVTSQKASTGWKGLRVAGILDFSLTGIINDLTKPLKENRIPVFVISTYNTDYIFVKEESFERTLSILKTIYQVS
jgi:uncharacterized protein